MLLNSVLNHSNTVECMPSAEGNTYTFLFVIELCFFFLSSYEAEVAYVDIKSEDTNTNGKRVLCCHNCSICSTKAYLQHSNTGSDSRQNETRWLKSKGRFLSIGAAVISCRNEKAPDGLVADAHLSDGFLHLILIRDCHHALYLW